LVFAVGFQAVGDGEFFIGGLGFLRRFELGLGLGVGHQVGQLLLRGRAGGETAQRFGQVAEAAGGFDVLLVLDERIDFVDRFVGVFLELFLNAGEAVGHLAVFLHVRRDGGEELDRVHLPAVFDVGVDLVGGGGGVGEE